MKIIRQTQFSKFGSKLTLFLGDNYQIILRNKEEISFNIGSETLPIRLRRQLLKPIQVTNDNLIRISDNSLKLSLFWSSFIIILISHLLMSFDSDYLFWISLFAVLLLFSSLLLSPVTWTIEKEVKSS